MSHSPKSFDTKGFSFTIKFFVALIALVGITNMGLFLFNEKTLVSVEYDARVESKLSELKKKNKNQVAAIAVLEKPA